MQRRLLWTAMTVLLASLANAQSLYPVGIRDFSFLNGTGRGSPALAARIHYPAIQAGVDAPILTQAGGWPVVVHLHGYSLLGNHYARLANHLAAAGFITVLSDTAQFDTQLQELDGRALFSALTEANQDKGGLFEGLLDVTRAGLLGHSMGGANVANVLADNPGYRCGFALAPASPRPGNAARVQAPLGLVAGTGDTITPWDAFALPYYQALTDFKGLKFLYLMDADCDHMNVAGLFLSGSISTAVFERVASVALGFFHRFLENDAAGLEHAVGPTALGEPRLLSLSLAVETPELWTSTPIRIGRLARFSIAAEPGVGGLLVAARPGLSPTPFGSLLLDQATLRLLFVGLLGPERRLDWSLTVPPETSLIGIALFAQAYGPTAGAPLRLGSASRVELRD